MRRKQLWFVIAALIMVNCLTIAIFLTKGNTANGASLKKDVVATVGKKEILRQDWLNELEARYGKDVLKDMIHQKVVKEMAKKYKITVSNQDVEREFRIIQTTYHSSSEKRQEDENRWKEQIRNSLLLEEILTKDVAVSEQEKKNYFNQNKDLFDIPSAFHLSQIIVKTEAEAEKSLKELSQGSSFSTMAMERSTDEFSANDGGDIGYITEDDDRYPLEYVLTAKTLKAGEWSKPVKVEQGYAILKLESKIKGESYSYQDVKEEIRRQIALEQMKVPASARTFWDEAKVSWFYGKEKSND
ncbi:peptidyl-prolyl cis-trans isomerase [Bacillus sp. UNC438CL73TsuS30]|uniref:peptidyl-prolyl cis-trans isomerase n=1 Tax=Bacillus sp. UNC438CL73TsuS30 TaxID=1340434 RepID=UPI00047E8DFD|nr:peptidyl-prolyl cis-trans isomerase [Bacillus sp. UNC438CL73TsuS30]